MASKEELVKLVAGARGAKGSRRFSQSFEMMVSLREVDPKKHDLNFNETVFLPNRFTKKPKTCVIASQDLAMRASRAGADKVMPPEELERLAASKRVAKTVGKSFDFFLAETAQMAKIGRILGPILGPRGKMPTPLPPNAPVESMVERMKSAVRVRSRSQLGVTCKVGDEELNDSEVADNALAVIAALEGKLPMGARNIGRIAIKTAMGKVVRGMSVGS